VNFTDREKVHSKSPSGWEKVHTIREKVHTVKRRYIQWRRRYIQGRRK